MKLTIFEANVYDVPGKQKIPISPSGDKEFIFKTFHGLTPREMYQLMVSNFILNIPLNLTKPIKARRRIQSLKKYMNEEINYIILDIDDVVSFESMNKILDYFRKYKCIIGESKSHNAIDNFRLKGILFIEPLSVNNAKVLISQIHHELKEYCCIDEAVTRRVSLNAPINKMKILLESDAELYEFNESNAKKIIESHRESYELDQTNLINATGDSIESLCLGVFESMGFKELSREDNVIKFSHSNEIKTPGGYFWFWSSPYTMHHFNSTKSINIFDSVRKLDAAKNLIKKEIDYDSALYKKINNTNTIIVDEQFLKLNNEISSSIETFVHKPEGLFCIKSPMGTGKSTIIGHIIKECHEEDMRVLIITNRISVAQDFSNKYSIKLYNKDKYNVGDSVVVQYDSLWKYNIKNFDIVIMDEFISLMLHSRNNLSNSSVNLAKFFASFQKKLVIADAFLTGYENFLVNHKKSNIHLLDNHYRDTTELYNYSDFNYFVKKILDKSRVLDKKNNEKITISSTSLSVINELELLLSQRGLNTVTLTADTSETTKELVYGLFEEDHDKFDVLLYSPTLTVGVSNLNNVKDHFHYDSSMSSDVISSLQMIKRSRKAQRIHLLIKPRIQYIRTSYNEIRDDYINNMGQNIGQNYLFEVDNYGEPRLSKIGVKAIKIDTFSNILEFNHRDAFFYLCKYHFKDAPINIDKKFSETILDKCRIDLRKSNEMLIKNRINEFLLLNDIEKYDISIGKLNADRVMKTIIDVDSMLVECSPEIKVKILELSLENPNFIKTCRLYKRSRDFLLKELTPNDISRFIHDCVINKTDDLKFYKHLLNLEKPLKKSYHISSVNKNKSLKYVLDEIGYRKTKDNEVIEVGYRGIVEDADVVKYCEYIN